MEAWPQKHGSSLVHVRGQNFFHGEGSDHREEAVLCCLLTTSLQPCQATKKPSGRIACVDEAALVPVPWVAL